MTLNIKSLFSLLICLIMFSSLKSQTEVWKCIYNWNGQADAVSKIGQIPTLPNTMASTNDYINLGTLFLDREGIKGPCLPSADPTGIPIQYYISYPNSSYEVSFVISNGNYASFKAPNISMPNITVGAHRRDEGSGPYSFNVPATPLTSAIIYSILNEYVMENDPVVLYFRPAWSPSSSGASPPPITVTATVTDITPAGDVPPMHTGSCTDLSPLTSSSPLTYSWTFTYSTLCPNYLALNPGTSPNNQWIDFLGNHQAQTCWLTYSDDVIPFCYTVGPAIPPYGPDYPGRIINEVLSSPIPDFNLSDLKPEFKADYPLMSLNGFANLIFHAASPATFTVDGYDKILDSHGPNSLVIKSSLLPNDSVLLNTYLKLDTEVVEESTRLLKIQHQNYLNIGNFYLNIYHDKPKAEEYFIKVRRYPFYTNENNDMYYFKNLYVLASIGQIKCRQGDYAGLKELDFIPSAFPDIAPTYKMFIEDAGGKCEKCERYFEQSGEKKFKSYLPPIEDKGGQ